MSRYFTVHAIYALDADMPIENGLLKDAIVATDGEDWYYHALLKTDTGDRNPNQWPLRLFRDYWRVLPATDGSPWIKTFHDTPKTLIKGQADD